MGCVMESGMMHGIQITAIQLLHLSVSVHTFNVTADRQTKVSFYD